MHRSTRGAVDRSGIAESLTRWLSLDWPLTLPWLAETPRAWKVIAGFIEERACTRTSEGDGS